MSRKFPGFKQKRRYVLSLGDAPAFEPLQRKPVANSHTFSESTLRLTVPTFGLTPEDIEAGKLAALERAEARAWYMLRVCQWCERRFLPAKRNCSCCSRGCYLKAYRKRESKRYAGYMRRWRENRSAEGGTPLDNGGAACQ